MMGIPGGMGSGVPNIQQSQGSISQVPGQGVAPGQGSGVGPGVQQPSMPLMPQVPGGMRATLPGGMTLMPGQTMFGQVVGRQGNAFLLRFGAHTLRAESQLSLSVGQRIEVAFTGNRAGNQVQLQLLKSFTFTQMSNSDLTQVLSKLNVPVNDKSLSIARGLVEHKMPLTSGNMADFTRAAATLPRPMTSTDMSAMCLLKMADIPMTPNNIMTLSNFIAQNPQLGSQLFELQNMPGGQGRMAKTKEDQRTVEVLQELKSNAIKYVLDPKKQSQQQMSKNLKNLAQEQGIEGIKHGFGGSNMEEGWELAKLLQELQNLPEESLQGVLQDADKSKALVSLAKDIEQNLAAHQLLNNGKPLPEQAYYLMQIPLRMENEDTTAVVRIGYDEGAEGEKSVDPENTRIEFDVNTEYLGEIHVNLLVKNGRINVDIGVRKAGLEEFVDRFTPTLKRSLEKLGYDADHIKTGIFNGIGRPLIHKEDFEKMETVDVSA